MPKDKKKPFKRPVKGQKDKPRKPLSGKPGKTDRPKSKPKKKKVKKKLPTVRGAKEAIGKRREEMKRRLKNI